MTFSDGTGFAARVRRVTDTRAATPEAPTDLVLSLIGTDISDEGALAVFPFRSLAPAILGGRTKSDGAARRGAIRAPCAGRTVSHCACRPDGYSAPVADVFLGLDENGGRRAAITGVLGHVTPGTLVKRPHARSRV